MSFVGVFRLAKTPIQHLRSMMESPTKRRRLDADMDKPAAVTSASDTNIQTTPTTPDSPTTPSSTTFSNIDSASGQPICSNTRLDSDNDSMATSRPRTHTMNDALPEPKRVAIRKTVPIIQQPQTEVIESDAYLRPHQDCVRVHMLPFNKGKYRYGSIQGRRCGDYAQCEELDMPDDYFIDRDYHLQTAVPLDDLKRFMTTSDRSHDGTPYNREDTSRKLIETGRFSYQDIENAILFAVQQVWDLHKTISSLKEYGRRQPYELFRWQPAPKAESLKSLAGEDDVKRMSERALLEELDRMVLELDYLNEVVEEMTEDIVARKWSLALQGELSEIEHLVQLGIVSQAQVDEYCGVYMPD